MKGRVKYLKNVSTLELFEDRCTGCGMCAVVCPHGVFEVRNGSASIVDRDACMECGACSLNCPELAISVQAGVGCAQAIINSALGRRGSSCCNLDDYGPAGASEEEEVSNCGCDGAPESRIRSGCC